MPNKLSFNRTRRYLSQEQSTITNNSEKIFQPWFKEKFSPSVKNNICAGRKRCLFSPYQHFNAIKYLHFHEKFIGKLHVGIMLIKISLLMLKFSSRNMSAALRETGTRLVKII